MFSTNISGAGMKLEVPCVSVLFRCGNNKNGIVKKNESIGRRNLNRLCAMEYIIWFKIRFAFIIPLIRIKIN